MHERKSNNATTIIRHMSKWYFESHNYDKIKEMGQTTQEEMIHKG
jgi:hypothetical protein